MKFAKFAFLAFTIVNLCYGKELNEKTIEFIFTHTAEMQKSPRLIERITRMEVTFNADTMKGKIKSYSPFSNSFELLDVDVRFVDKGIHFLEEKKKGNAILSLSFNDGEATYSCSTISYGVLLSYQLYGKGRFLEKR